VRKADNLATSRVVCLEIWEPQTPGTLWACNMPVQGLLHLSLTIHIHIYTHTPTHRHLHTHIHIRRKYVRLHTHRKGTKNARRNFTGWMRHSNKRGICYTMFVRTRVHLSYGFGVRISCRLKKISTCTMAYVYRLFRYNFPVISTLQDFRDQAASTPVIIHCGCKENAVTALAYLSQENCSKFVQQPTYFLFRMKYSEM
jgi:hypothetical protein